MESRGVGTIRARRTAAKLRPRAGHAERRANSRVGKPVRRSLSTHGGEPRLLQTRKQLRRQGWDTCYDDLAGAADNAVDHAWIASVPGPRLAFEGHVDGRDVVEGHAHFGDPENVEFFFIVARRVEQAVVAPAAAGATALTPTGDDLREGKRTALIAVTMERASPMQLKELSRNFGDPNLTNQQVSTLQSIIVETGAQAHIESMIEELTNTSLSALTHDEISTVGKALLTELADIATNRKI